MGGIERALSTLANYFVKKGFEVHFVTIYPFEPFFCLNTEIRLYVPPYVYNKSGRNIFQTLNYYRYIFSPFHGYLKKTIQKINPDTIMCFGDWFPHLSMLVLKGKYPFYYANRSNPNIKYNLVFEFIRKLAYKLYPPTGIIAQTTLAKLRKERIFRSIFAQCPPIKVIPNPARKVKYYNNIKRENIIISVGRLHLEKGFIRLMDIFSKLNAPNWKLMIVGGGIHEAEIKQKAVDLGIESKVIFTGSQAEIDKFLAKAKIYVMSSYKEGFPNALCEAMAAGLACLSFDIVAGPSDIINNGIDGILVPDDDLIEMQDKIQYLIDNPMEIERLGTAAKEIVNRLSLDRIGKEYLNFILSYE